MLEFILNTEGNQCLVLFCILTLYGNRMYSFICTYNLSGDRFVILQKELSSFLFLFLSYLHFCAFLFQVIKNILTRRQESDAYLATVSRHPWSLQIAMKVDKN